MPAPITEAVASCATLSHVKPTTPKQAPTASVTRAPIRRTSTPPNWAPRSETSVVGSRYTTDASSTEAPKP